MWKNCEDQWAHIYEVDAEADGLDDEDDEEGPVEHKYSRGTSGSSVYGGWDTDGRQEFDKDRAKCHKGRFQDHSLELEEQIRKVLCARHELDEDGNDPNVSEDEDDNKEETLKMQAVGLHIGNLDNVELDSDLEPEEEEEEEDDDDEEDDDAGDDDHNKKNKAEKKQSKSVKSKTKKNEVTTVGVSEEAKEEDEEDDDATVGKEEEEATPQT